MATLPEPGTRRGLWGLDLIDWLLVSHTEDGGIRPETAGNIIAGLATQASLSALSNTVDTKASIVYVDEELGTKADVTALEATDLALGEFINDTGLTLGGVENTIDPLTNPGANGQFLSVDDGVPAWATLPSPPVTSVNGSDGDVVLDADDIDDSATTHKFTTSTELSKLSGIEEGADVTDATNVASAGAVMTSGPQSVAGVKTFSDQPVVPEPTTGTAAANKAYVDDMDWHPAPIVVRDETTTISVTGTETLAEVNITLEEDVLYLVTFRGSCNAEGGGAGLATATLSVTSSTMAGSPTYTTPAQTWEQGVDTTHVAEDAFLVTGTGASTACALWTTVSAGTLSCRFSRLVVTAMPYGRV